MPTSEIRADWAAQRIKNLSFFRAAWSAFFGNRDNKVTSLISKFNYPRYGPGQMWETMTDDIQELGGQVLLEHKVTKLDFEGDRCVRVHAGDQVFEPSAVISSLPLRNTVGMAEPHPQPEVIAAAKGLRYRDFLTVAVVLDGEDLFPDNWIYIHDPNVNVGPHPELPLVEPVDGAGPLEGVRRASSSSASPATSSGRPTTRSSSSSACASSSSSGWRSATSSSSASSSACRRPTRCTTPTTTSASHDPLVARRARQLHPGRPQRAAPLQQLRPLLAHRDARRGQPREGHRPRHLGGQRRVGVPRGGASQDEQQPYIEAPETEAMKEPLHS